MHLFRDPLADHINRHTLCGNLLALGAKGIVAPLDLLSLQVRQLFVFGRGASFNTLRTTKFARLAVNSS